MLIKQKRINSLRHFSLLEKESTFRLIVNNVERFPEKLIEFGFKSDSKAGTKILPAVVNRYALKNAEQYTTINRSLPKEDYYQTVYWTRTEWAGRGETREVTEFTDIKRQRYHRDFHLPFSVEFTLSEDNGNKFICSDEIILTDDNSDKIINTVNLLLLFFGECEITSNQIASNSKVIYVSWDILPAGKYPWSKVKSDIETIIENRNTTQQHMMLRNCEAINNLGPDFVAYGRAGFKGYAVFGFTKKNLYILESVIPNNATYIFENDWEELSKLSKAEILNFKLHKARIVHNANWEKEFEKIVEELKWEKISM
ncbi:hypothetical protein [Caproiciproducens faecalis]|jgi:hypothetical protein|uniref:Uncharacterized protein n=1 Tax=Caproiciproducens faecalis TaxID=2820301 RepID=A0ABS7DKY7_9FIRM|nr:hypothetical protein [Caproiciproducens faecalis]MBW7571201.1 hypothetical protein [Caproiciproducens faecalis]